MTILEIILFIALGAVIGIVIFFGMGRIKTAPLKITTMTPEEFQKWIGDSQIELL